MPVIPYGVRKRKSNRQPLTSAQIKTVRRIANNEIIRKADHKQFTAQITANCGQNTSYAANLLSGITQGTGVSDRIGQEINVSGVLIKIRFEKQSNTNALNMRFRVYKENLDTFSNFNSAATVLDANNDSIGLASNSTDVTLTPNDKFQVNVLRDELVDLSGYINTGSAQKSMSFWIPIKAKFQYQPGEVFMKNHNLYMTVGAHSFSSTGTVAGFRANYSVYYSD